MKNTGITRKVDDLGRVVLPSELRESLGINTQDKLEIYIDGEKIILTKRTETCIVCGNTEQLTKIKEKFICLNCLES